MKTTTLRWLPNEDYAGLVTSYRFDCPCGKRHHAPKEAVPDRVACECGSTHSRRNWRASCMAYGASALLLAGAVSLAVAYPGPALGVTTTIGLLAALCYGLKRLGGGYEVKDVEIPQTKESKAWMAGKNSR